MPSLVISNTLVYRESKQDSIWSPAQVSVQNMSLNRVMFFLAHCNHGIQLLQFFETDAPKDLKYFV